MAETASTSAQPSTAVATSALRHWPAHVLFWLAAGFILWLDLWSKHWVFANLKAAEIRSILPGWFEFRRSLNDGAVFGSFTGQTNLFIAASLLALGFVFYLFSTSRPWQRVLHLALGMVLAGAIGNLYDRAFMPADVIRFQNRSGQAETFIGTIVEDADDGKIRVGDWPDGGRPRTFRVEEIEHRKQGVVRDFIKFMPRFPEWTPKLAGRDMWPWIFNVADASLVCGVILLLLCSGSAKRGHHEDA